MTTHTNTLPPVGLGRLGGKARWRWIINETDGPFRPDGVLDMLLTLLLCAVACVPFLLVYCPLCWCLRTAFGCVDSAKGESNV